MVSVNPSQTWISAWISMNALKEAIIVQRKKVLSAGIIRVTTHASVQKDLKHITYHFSIFEKFKSWITFDPILLADFLVLCAVHLRINTYKKAVRITRPLTN